MRLVKALALLYVWLVVGVHLVTLGVRDTVIWEMVAGSIFMVIAGYTMAWICDTWG